MKTTMTVLFVIAIVLSSTQTFRHVYVKWIEPDTSVLDEFRPNVDTDIESAKTLEELVVLYREARTRVKEYEGNERNPEVGHRVRPKTHPDAAVIRAPPSGRGLLGRTHSERRHTEPYNSELRIENEIRNREYDHHQLFKLKFYWFAGLISFLIGVFVLDRFNAWLGFSGIVAGFSEMLCWTSPLFHNRILSQQFEDLLNYKLVFSFITWVILIVVWLLADKRKLREKNG